MIIALILGAIPIIPAYLMPIWALLFYSYWMIYTRTRNPALFALIIGIFFDVLQGDLLGQNSLALILSSLFIFRIRQSFYFSNTTTKQVYLATASLIYILVMSITQAIYIGILYVELRLLLAILTTPLVWPIVFWLSRKIYP